MFSPSICDKKYKLTSCFIQNSDKMTLQRPPQVSGPMGNILQVYQNEMDGKSLSGLHKLKPNTVTDIFHLCFYLPTRK